MHDKFRKRHKVAPVSGRARHQIALEAARRMFEAIAPKDAEGPGWIDEASEGDYYSAKRKAAAVLGHRVRPGDLPSNSEVREQLIALARSRSGLAFRTADHPEPDDEGGIESLADHLDRFAIYKMRLEPLESVKQNPRYH